MSAFGRRRSDVATFSEAARVLEVQAPEPPKAEQPLAINSDLRNLCLARLDMAAVAGLPQDRLTAEIEQLIATIATERSAFR